MRYIELTNEERDVLESKFRKMKSPVVRKRIDALLLSSQYNSMSQISNKLGISRTSLYHFFNEWENTECHERLRTLFIKKGRGAKSKLEPVKEHLPLLVEKYNRNIKKILKMLECEYGIQVCGLTLQKYLKKMEL